jgi:hypothetical protein
MAIERSELRLVWPPSLFAAEARALLEADADDEALGGLMAEAFHGDRGEQLLLQVARAEPHRAASTWDDDPWAVTPTAVSAPDPEPPSSRATAQLVAELARDADDLPRHVARPLFSQRQQPSPAVILDAAACKGRFAQLVVELSTRGYFEDAFGSQCSDARDENPDIEGQRQLAERLGHVEVALWPLRLTSNVFSGATSVHESWPDELFFDIIEALDELVARPRQRHWHDYHREWDYSDYSRPAGQAVYRWRVNELLSRSNLPLRLAETGNDAGLLVRATGDPRDKLLDRALATPSPKDRDEVQHAIELYRSRAAGRADKRSAIFTLGRLLEERRPVIDAALSRKDSGALFQIANEFDLRHRRAASHGKAQRDDYDDAFLDWVFWWYLATVELTDRLLSDADGSSRSAAADR